jgi:periplasmic divalent cation tolerance protein
METGCLQVVVAVDTEATAAGMSERLIAERLAACVQVGGPVTSRYHWEGEVKSAQEFVLVAKTTERRLAALIETVREMHPYETPEIVALPIVDGLHHYLDWVHAETALPTG